MRHELGGGWALLLLALTATDPVFVSHARLDWGPHVIAAFVRVLALIALWRWLQTGRMFWLVTTCIALLIGFVDKLNFLWVIVALVGAGALVAPHTMYARLRMAAPLATCGRRGDRRAAAVGCGNAGAQRCAARRGG